MVDPLELLDLESLSRLTERLQSLVRERLWAKVLIGLVAGVGIGVLLGPGVDLVPQTIARPTVEWLAFPGALFLALIQMIVVPLVFASIIRGLTASENLAQLRSVGGRAIGFFAVTTAIAVVIGIAVATFIAPGRYISASMVTATAAEAEPVEAATLPSAAELPTVISGLLPSNPLASMVGGEMLQIILFAVLVGIALLSLPPERSSPLYDLMGSLQHVCMTVVGWAMRMAPLAVFGLMARLTATVGFDTLAGMGIYVVTVLAGLAILLIVYVVVAAFIRPQGTKGLVGQTRELLLLAFSTSSSAAVMPMTIETVRGLGVRDSIARFVVPMGATMNMTGTAVYQGAATLFLAQVYGVELGLPALGLVVLTSVAASIGSPATPGVGMVILATVLQGVGIPASGIVLLIGVDRILDMSRTAVNVAGDIVACLVVDRSVADSPGA